MMDNRNDATVNKILFFLSVAFIFYETLIPFNFSGISLYKRMVEINWIPFFNSHGNKASITDAIQNIILFIPFGFLWPFLLKRPSHILNFSILLLSGSALSAAVETLQLCTIDRTTSITDLITNTLGTGAGYAAALIARVIWNTMQQLPPLKRLLSEQTCISVVILFLLIIIELSRPFDFSLDFDFVYAKIMGILHNPFYSSFTLRDSVFALFLYAVFSFQIFRLFHVINWREGLVLFTGLIFLVTGVVSIQLIIRSRSPEISDCITGCTGILLGSILFYINKPQVSTMAFSAIYLCSLIYKFYAPFVLKNEYTPVTLIPYFLDSSRASIHLIGNSIETGILFGCGGYLAYRFFKFNSGSKFLFLLFALAAISGVELLQGYFRNRYPEITDIFVGWIFLWGGLYFGHKGIELLRKKLLSGLEEIP